MRFILNTLRNACYFSREDVVKEQARYIAGIQYLLCSVDRASRYNCV
jgi:hypothetical protein